VTTDALVAPLGTIAIPARSEMRSMTGVSLGTMHRAGVMLVGSANIDLVVRTRRFPLPGETLQGSEFRTFAGGKGANQAAAIGRLGGRAQLVAKVGVDAFGDQVIASLTACGVGTSFVLRDPIEATGVALITVDEHGQNTIVVAPGTNSLLTASEVRAACSAAEFSVLLAQLEIPLECVLEANHQAGERTFILNPAPARVVPPELLSRVDYLTPNETEAEILTGILPTDTQSCLAAAMILLDKGVQNVLFTLGAQGSFLANAEGGRHFPSIEVDPVDTTGAGDAFNGAFAHLLASGEPVDWCIHLANIAGALSTTKPGAQASMPTLAEVLDRAAR